MCINLNTGFVTFGVDFFTKHIISIEDLLFLILHERNHYILEHSIWRSDLYYLRRSLPGPLVALVEDAFINAAAFRTSPSKINDRFYSHKRFEVLLTSDSKGVEKVYKDKDLTEVHTQMWDPESPLPDLSQFCDAFIDWFHRQREQEQNAQTQNQENETGTGSGDGDNNRIDQDDTQNDQGSDKDNDESGDDEKDNPGTNEDLDGDWGSEEYKDDGFKSEIEKEAEAINLIVEGHNDTPVALDDHNQEKPEGCTESGTRLYGKKIEAVPPKSEFDKALGTLTHKEREQFSVQRSFDVSHIDNFISDFQCLRAGQDGMQGYTSTVPHKISKRDLNSIQMGGMPVMWNTTYNGFEVQTRLYMDVSGSMDRFIGLIPYIFARLMEHVCEIYEFSTQIVKVDPQDPYYYSTGCTSFNMVAKHIIEKGFQSVIVITDGCSALSNKLAEQLQNQLEYCVYIKIGRSSYRSEKGWGDIADQVVHIAI